MNTLKKSWRGEEKLWITFWCFFILLNVLTQLVVIPVALFYGGQLFYPVLAILGIVWLYTATLVFKCAKNSCHWIFGLLAKAVVVLPTLGGIYDIVLQST